MGSWSESCGFSGIEIGEGEEVLVGLVGKPKYSDFGGETHFELKTPMIRGTYNDYGYLSVSEDEGVLALFNHLSGLTLKNGDDYCGNDHFVPEMKRFWIRRDVHDSLRDLKQDFAYYGSRDGDGGFKHIKVKNIGHSVDLHIADIKAAVEKSVADKEKWTKLLEGTDLKDMSPEDRHKYVSSLCGTSFRDVLGYGHNGIDWHAILCNPPLEVSHADAIEAYRRWHLLMYAASELRKKIVPSEKGGPQHGGEQASCQFARAILKIQKQRKKRWD